MCKSLLVLSGLAQQWSPQEAPGRTILPSCSEAASLASCPVQNDLWPTACTLSSFICSRACCCSGLHWKFPDYLVERTHNHAVVWDMHPRETHNTWQSLDFHFTDGWRHSWYPVNCIYWDLVVFILPLYPYQINVLCRSPDFTWFDGKTGLQKDLSDFLHFPKIFFFYLAPCNDAINVLQLFWSSTPFQGTPYQSMANGGAVFAHLGQ